MREQVPLETLYRLVPATQEEDLLQELAEERRQPHERLVGCELYWPRGPHAVGAAEPVSVADDQPQAGEFDAPTPSQALGLVLHLLGGSVLPDR